MWDMYACHKNNKTMSFTTTWMNLELVILSEVNQSEEEIAYDIACIWNLKKMIQMYLFTQQKATHRLSKETYGGQGGRIKGGIVREFGIDMFSSVQSLSRVRLFATQ